MFVNLIGRKPLKRPLLRRFKILYMLMMRRNFLNCNILEFLLLINGNIRLMLELKHLIIHFVLIHGIYSFQLSKEQELMIDKELEYLFSVLE